MYKYLISILSLLLVSSPVFAWDYFCSVKGDVIEISINSSVGILCDDYIANLDLLLLNTAKEIVNLNALIKKGNDIDYWASIRSKKQEEMQKFSLLKEHILSHIENFSYTFFIKIRDYVILSIKDDIESYIKTFKRIQRFQENYKKQSFSDSLSSYQESLVDILITVQNIYIAQDSNEILKHYRKYIYLRGTLKGKFE